MGLVSPAENSGDNEESDAQTLLDNAEIRECLLAPAPPVSEISNISNVVRRHCNRIFMHPAVRWLHPMPFSHTVGNRTYTFADLRTLLAKATPLRSGDALAGLAAGSAEERVAAQFALAELPLRHFLNVAIGDEIGEAFGAKLSVMLIGERPGLSSPDSLGIYITWAPRQGRTDAERNCISNVREGGLSHAEAAAQLFSYITAARQQHLTGVALKRDAFLPDPR